MDPLIRPIPRERLFAPLEYAGKWWFDSDEAHPIYGRMRFVLGGNAELEFFDAARSQIQPPAGNAFSICGLSESNESVILFGAGLRKSTGSWKLNTRASVVTALFEYYDGWIGECKFTRKEDVVFDSVAIRVNNLEQWWGTTPVCVNGTPQPSHFGGWIDSQSVNPLKVFTNDSVSITLQWTESVSRKEKGIIQTRATLDCVPEILIESRQGKMPFYGKSHSFSYWLELCHDWFGLLIGPHAVLLDCWGLYRTEDEFPSETIACRRLWRQDADEESAKIVDRNHIRFPYEAIAGNWEKCTERFFGLPHNIHGFSGQMRYQQLNPGVIPVSLIPSLVFIFEGLEETLYPAANKAIRRQKKGAAPTEPERFAIVWEDLKEIYPMLEGVETKLFSDLSEKRNAWSHGRDSGHEDRDWSLNIYEAWWMWTFLSAMILAHAGLPVPVIASCLNRLEWDYGDVCQRLRHSLAALPDRPDQREQKRTHPSAPPHPTLLVSPSQVNPVGDSTDSLPASNPQESTSHLKSP